MENYKSQAIVKLSGVTRESLRFYERKGLLEPPQRNKSGYRQYNEHHLDRLCFIKAAQQVGFTLQEIKNLLDLKLEPQDICEETQQAAQSKITEIDQKIITLSNMRRSLVQFTKDCKQGLKVNCNFVVKGISGKDCCL
jgi:MerR family transcriptional regulator, copper efflux regulator